MSKEKPLAEKDMSERQLECYRLLCRLFRGAHHVPNVYACGNGIRCNVYGTLATWDFNELTRLVILCHDMCIRAEVRQGAPGGVGIALWKRNGRDGYMYERHPTLEEAIKMCRGAK